MTKPKKKFSGAWIDETLLGGGVPVELELAERKRVCGLLKQNDVKRAPVLSVLYSELGKWRFERNRLETEPEVSQWQEMLRAIDIPDEPTLQDLLNARAQISGLPVRVLSVLSTLLFRRLEIGHPTMLDRMLNNDPSDIEALKAVIAEILVDAKRLKGKRGPRALSNAALVNLIRAISQNSRLSKTASAALAAEILQPLVRTNAKRRVPKSRSRLAKIASGITKH